jgi:hypothetical protein
MRSTASDNEDWTNGYPISDKFRESFDNIVPRWRATPLPAFDSDDNFIKITYLEVSLRGSLVLVYFELKHYAIRDKRSNCVSTNTFSATASQVKILELGGNRKASPYKTLMLKGPKTLPQSPSKKKEQASAVRAFHPGKLFTVCFASGAEKKIEFEYDSRSNWIQYGCRKREGGHLFEGRR